MRPHLPCVRHQVLHLPLKALAHGHAGVQLLQQQGRVRPTILLNFGANRKITCVLPSISRYWEEVAGGGNPWLSSYLYQFIDDVSTVHAAPLEQRDCSSSGGHQESVSKAEPGVSEGHLTGAAGAGAYCAGVAAAQSSSATLQPLVHGILHHHSPECFLQLGVRAPIIR